MLHQNWEPGVKWIPLLTPCEQHFLNKHNWTYINILDVEICQKILQVVNGVVNMWFKRRPLYTILEAKYSGCARIIWLSN